MLSCEPARRGYDAHMGRVGWVVVLVVGAGCSSNVVVGDEDGEGGAGGAGVGGGGGASADPAACIAELEPSSMVETTSKGPCEPMGPATAACGAQVERDGECVVAVDCECLVAYEACGAPLNRSCYARCFPFVGEACE